MAHGGGGHGGGGKKKRGLVQTCLTSTIAVIVFIYIAVLLGSALITTFFQSHNPPLISFSSGSPQSATTNPNPAPPAAAPTPAPAVTPVKMTVSSQPGSNSTGGSTTLTASTLGAPTMGNIQVTADGPYYIVEQADLVQNGAVLSVADSLQLIADKLLTTVADLKAVNPALNDASLPLVPGEVLRVPSTVTQPSPNNGGGNLPATGQYASP